MLSTYRILVKEEYDSFGDYVKICALGLQHNVVPKNKRQLIVKQMAKFEQCMKQFPKGVDMIQDAPEDGKALGDYYSYRDAGFRYTHHRDAGLCVYGSRNLEGHYEYIKAKLEALSNNANTAELEREFDQLKTCIKSSIYMKVELLFDEDDDEPLTAKGFKKLADHQLSQIKYLQSFIDKIQKERARKEVISLRTVATRGRTEGDKPLRTLDPNSERIIASFLSKEVQAGGKKRGSKRVTRK
jgi:hypothetical protein